MQTDQSSKTPESAPKCPSCGSAYSSGAKFCAQCGARRVSARTLQGKRLFLIPVVTVLVWVPVWFSMESMIGIRPTKYIEMPSGSGSHMASQPQTGRAESLLKDDEEIAKLKADVEQAPEDVEKWRALAEAVGKRYNAHPDNAEIIFELITALRGVLDRAPEDPTALISMANLSFDRQVFDKAKEYYALYLTLQPDDLVVRARYANSLTFLGEFDRAISELNSILEKEPKNFHALAFLSVAYAQQGDIPKALSTADVALASAPSDEARTRIEAFVESIKKEQTASAASSSEVEGSDPIVTFIQQNPVAGPKFVRSERDGGVLKLYFKAFPMSQMPPFAKQAFFGKLKPVLETTSTTSKVQFFDVDSNTLMEEVTN